MEKFAFMRSLLEYDYDDYDYDREDARADAYDSSDRFNDTEPLQDSCVLDIGGHKVEFNFKADQDVAVDGEDATFHDPGWSEIVEYGLVKNLETIEDLKIDGIYVADQLILFDGCDANDVKSYDDSLTIALDEFDGEIDPRIKQIVTPEFSKLFALKFYKYLKAKENYA